LSTLPTIDEHYINPSLHSSFFLHPLALSTPPNHHQCPSSTTTGFPWPSPTTPSLRTSSSSSATTTTPPSIPGPAVSAAPPDSPSPPPSRAPPPPSPGPPPPPSTASKAPLAQPHQCHPQNPRFISIFFSSLFPLFLRLSPYVSLASHSLLYFSHFHSSTTTAIQIFLYLQFYPQPSVSPP